MNQSQPPVSRIPRALVIEDNEDQALIIRRWLELDCGYLVEIAHDGATGRREILSGHYDVVITDVGLPDSTGIELLELSKEHYPDRPTIVVTANGESEIILGALRRRADDFWLKPLQRTDIVARLQAMVRSSQQRQAAERQTVLAIGAHPDDVEIGCGATLVRHRARGDRVVVCVLSNGSRGGDQDARRQEAEFAAKTLGAKIHFGNFPDGQISDGPETIGFLEEVVRTHTPDVVYTHTLNDVHQDHRAVARASLVAVRSVGNVYCYQSPSTNVDFRPTRFIDVEGLIERKLSLLEAFSTQCGRRPYLEPEQIRAAAAYWGRYAGFRDVEPLEVVRDRH